MKRNHRWGQDNPRDQLRVILGAIEGDLLNLDQPRLSGLQRARIRERCLELLTEAHMLAEGLPEGQWTPNDS